MDKENFYLLRTLNYVFNSDSFSTPAEVHTPNLAKPYPHIKSVWNALLIAVCVSIRFLTLQNRYFLQSLQGECWDSTSSQATTVSFHTLSNALSSFDVL